MIPGGDPVGVQHPAAPFTYGAGPCPAPGAMTHFTGHNFRRPGIKLSSSNQMAGLVTVIDINGDVLDVRALLYGAPA